jgi:hypothetical protein
VNTAQSTGAVARPASLRHQSELGDGLSGYGLRQSGGTEARANVVLAGKQPVSPYGISGRMLRFRSHDRGFICVAIED